MDILYQDESLLAVNKPAGLLSIQDGYDPELTTVKKEIEKEFGRCWIVHRLDKETSGVMLLARNAATHRLLNMAFQNHKIKKIYHALVIGIPDETCFSINRPLKVDGDRRHRTIIDNQSGKPAVTNVMVLTSFSNLSLVSVEPQTGYTHQIRAHLADYGFPLLCDSLYQNRSQIITNELPKMERVALHAFQIRFSHPTTDQEITLRAEYPEDFRNILDTLK